MKNRKPGSIATTIMMTFLLLLVGGFAVAAENSPAPMTPEYAAKRENTRKQHEQIITHEKRKAGADRLKEERLKVYKAKQLVKHQKSKATDNK